MSTRCLFACVARFALARFALARFALARFARARFALARFALAWRGGYNNHDAFVDVNEPEASATGFIGVM